MPQVGKEIEWSGSGEQEVGKEKGTDIVRIKVNPKYYRPAEVVRKNTGTSILVKLFWKDCIFVRSGYIPLEGIGFSYSYSYYFDNANCRENLRHRVSLTNII